MPPLTTDFPSQDRFPVATTHTVQKIGNERGVLRHTTYQISEWDVFGLNARALHLLKEIRKLKDNWDEDGAKAPDKKALYASLFLAIRLQITGEKIYHVAPGPNGEILVDMRENGKSLEFLFYPNKFKVVFLPSEGRPEQKEFRFADLPQILKWLHE